MIIMNKYDFSEKNGTGMPEKAEWDALPAPDCDLHVHMVLDGADWKAAMAEHSPVPDEALIRERLDAYRGAGVTFLRDGGDSHGACLKAKELAPEYGITYLAPAFPIYKKGHYGGFIGRGWTDYDGYMELVNEAADSGADFIKLMISGLMDFDRAGKVTEAPLSSEEITDIADMAHDEGFAVMAHCNGSDAALAAAEAGIETIEHGAFLSRRAIDAMADARTIWIPTLSPIANLVGCGRFPDGSVLYDLRTAQENIRYAVSKGVRVGLGSDAGAYMVPHVTGARTEYALLRMTLGQDTDEIIGDAERLVRKMF